MTSENDWEKKSMGIWTFSKGDSQPCMHKSNVSIFFITIQSTLSYNYLYTSIFSVYELLEGKNHFTFITIL